MKNQPLLHSFELAIALRYLKARRHGLFAFITTLIAISGVTLGVASLIVTLSVMNGFRSDIQKKTLGIQPHIVLFGTEKDSLIMLDALIDKTKLIQDINSVSPFILGQALLKSNRTTQGIVLKGILPEKEFNVTEVQKTLIFGNWNALFEKSPCLILGNELARNLGVSVGDHLLVISPEESAALGAMGNIPKIAQFRVTGIFQSGMYEFDANMAFTSLDQTQKLFGIPGVTGLGIKTKNLEKADMIAQKFAEKAGSRYWVRSWQSMNRNLFQALKLEKIVMAIILTMIILVASFTIISILILISIEKLRDIGILKALGATRKTIRKIFLYAGMTLGFAGISLGTFLGVLIATILEKTKWIKLPQDVYYIDRLPIQLSFLDISLVMAATFLITILSSIYPATQAARVNPVDAIRYG
ncbi:MAG: ABC transporter permease [Elusimicrobia bacterium]|nr:ABC transporter permease [Elusimicrobiota bacterium]